MSFPVTIITPTTGKKTLKRLCESIDRQTVSCVHILLWDDKREDEYLFPDPVTHKVKTPEDAAYFTEGLRYSIKIPGSMIQGGAAGSALRAIGMMAANTPFVTFADDDVWFEENHISNLLKVVQDKHYFWAYCKRKIWTDKNEYLGVDNFESVGDSPSRKVPYEMVDNNTMIFSRRFASSAAVLYRETKDYNDDRLMYAFLKQHAGAPGKSEEATAKQICPKKLEKMFRENCT